jgi:iron complex outermembrane receptor protein
MSIRFKKKMKSVFRIKILFVLMVHTPVWSIAQVLSDSTSLKEVEVRAYFKEHRLMRSPASVGIISEQALQNQPSYSLLPAINTISGVRMEERSPGSYRLSIRGSLLRSPFGVRNVKVYLDDFLLTDAGGNTYLNILDASAVGRIEILKGPEGSIFGANSGGVVLINSKRFMQDSSNISAGLTSGSYGLVHQNLSAEANKSNFKITLNESFQTSGGYRENSALNRKSFQLMPGWKYSKSAELNSLLMYSDLRYETPGGLTLLQSQQNPRSARLATAALPGASEQQAGIYNKTFLAGISHSKILSPRLRHVFALTGSVTDFVNPFITTYETRDETSVGLRTYLELSSDSSKRHSWHFQYGVEAQQTDSKKRNYVNEKGERGANQNFVDFKANQSFIFSRFSISPVKRLTAEAALSLNFYSYDFTNIFPVTGLPETRNFKPQLLPRVAFSYLINDYFALRGSASRGYSPPTIEEVRPSNRIINNSLQPEAGWNYETGIRLALQNNIVYLDAAIFRFDLNNAIVRRVDAVGEESFVNAGGTRQSGFEAELTAWIVPVKKVGIIRGLKFSESYTNSDFKFVDYIINSTNFAGNSLTGVPQHNLVSALNLYMPSNLSLYLQHSYVSAIPLNDANAFYADKYQLLQAKVMWQKQIRALNLRFFIGGDNLLNAKYSLGNDLNAAGSRFYNPAALRNYYAGLNVQF